MRQQRFPFIHSIVVCLLCGSLTQAADQKPISIPIDQFTQLNESEQKGLLLKAFQRRLEHAKNLYYEVDLNWLIYENQNELPGKLREAAMLRRCRHWLLGDSYRMDSDMFRPTEKQACQWISDGYDAKQRISKATFTDKKRSSGRIDRIHDSIISDNKYIFWLRGVYPHKSKYLFQYLIDHKAEFEIEAPVDDGKVQLTVNFQPHWTNKPGGKRIFILDPKKGFLPINGHSRWNELRVDGGQPMWRIERFFVFESKLVGDVWMPVKLREEIMSSSAPEILSTQEIEVTRIEHGTVKPADLAIQFTEGMKIVDAIKGESYTVSSTDKSE
ncbi:hypothetical protein Pan241w_00800 [Gimesia alba]|uniref:Outer membrane lipoprotein-sorting protein n=1 Tax=Gimesia alba TaxID=2527973 RepID=A0A517R808_9PLAN|nr:hypothetical protein [Gimesia alba]QDT40027.1 hypothetical protein Pan241w_00800 [Gimesia alba]